MRRFTKSCHQAGVVIHGTFILGLPVETQQSIENTINFCEGTRRLQSAGFTRRAVSGHGTLRMARQNGWFVKKDKTDLVETDGFAAKHAGISRSQQGQDF